MECFFRSKISQESGLQPQHAAREDKAPCKNCPKLPLLVNVVGINSCFFQKLKQSTQLEKRISTYKDGVLLVKTKRKKKARAFSEVVLANLVEHVTLCQP
jgi:hypothetical protein